MDLARDAITSIGQRWIQEGSSAEKEVEKLMHA
jgi:hypothetical protein